ncbi:outer membrane beta-barrel protein [Xanthomarina sp. F2636L]|uniref:outer membrane beta-barrel protein n=1 Tax=Xanthomarina sp. F2636L TaxID=2996018 RepID=UPI00225E0DAC|nr:outer membrane beta-barrel protein [Xanthomarina sp. F2636L]MCX7551452.1 outer membrane beta-barrel protein [Xanthomarina sp. F2636L]
MKNLLLSICFIFVVSISLSQSKKGIGFRGGINISKITNASLEHKTNAYFGIFYQTRISDFYALQPELGYSNQGGKTKNEGLIYVEYITIGVTNKFFLSPGLGLYLLARPGLDLDIDDTLIGLINRGEGSGNQATFIDFSMSFGFGFEFKNGLAIEARYKQGLIDVYSGSFHNFDSELYQDRSQFNSVFQIGLAYKFNTSKKD